METCIDDVLRAPAVPTVTATDEAGSSGSYAPPSATGEDPLGLAGERTEKPQSKFKPSNKMNWKMFYSEMSKELKYCLGSLSNKPLYV